MNTDYSPTLSSFLLSAKLRLFTFRLKACVSVLSPEEPRLLCSYFSSAHETDRGQGRGVGGVRGGAITGAGGVWLRWKCQ